MSSTQSASKAAPSDPKTAAAVEKSKETQKPNKVLEEDDEFEDFPAEGVFQCLPSMSIITDTDTYRLVGC
jgi:hypothetical protein